MKALLLGGRPLGRLVLTLHRAVWAGASQNGRPKSLDQGSESPRAFEVQVADVIRETPDCVTLLLEPDACAPGFRAGQYLKLTTQVDGAEHTRAYSISGRESGGLQVTIKAVEQGTVSRHMCQSVKPGQTVRATGPHGSFVLPEDRSAALAFLAVGSGITPILSMITTALQQDEKHPIRLVYANRTPADVIFADVLEGLEAEHPSLQVVHVLTKATRGWSGERGRLTGERAHALLAPGPDTHVYLCGPQNLIDATVTSLRGAGVEADKVHRERFTPRTRAASGLGQEHRSVSWLRSGIKDTQRPGESLLDAAIRVDAEVPFICEAGECGECKIRVLQGEVIHEPDTCLTAEESTDGFVLACSSYAVTDLEVDS